MYVIDVGYEDESIPRLMEINCFNCAGLYETDKKAVVDTANRIAWEEYQEYQKVE